MWGIHTSRTARAADWVRMLTSLTLPAPPASIVEDRFTVSGVVGVIPSTGQYLIQGSWNFDDAFAGGLGPLDVASLEWDPACLTIGNTAWTVRDYTG